MKSTPSTGGLIVAAHNKSSNTKSSDNKMNPLLKIGNISIVKRIVLTFQRVGVSPIVIVTGYGTEEIEHELANYEVIFLRNQNYENSEMFDYARIGLQYLQNKCDQVIFNPVSTAMFTPSTLLHMMESGEKVISPSFHGKSGHPLLLSTELVPQILEYSGDMGMRGALQKIGIKRHWLDVEDEGILYDVDAIDRLDQLLEKHNQHILHSFIQISIEKESSFFDSRTKLLLLLIQETHSVRNACGLMALSYSKAWNMLNQLEEELGYSVVVRKHGGNKGGKTDLTEAGTEFLEKYQMFEQKVRDYAKSEFDRLFL